MITNLNQSITNRLQINTFSIFLGANTRCVEQDLNEYFYAKVPLDYSIWREYDYEDRQPTDVHLLPYVGNGRLGLAVAGPDLSLYVKGRRSLSEHLPFEPLINVDVSEATFERASSVDFVDGVAHRIICMKLHETKQNVKVTDRIYAHRLVTPLLVQEVDIYNPSPYPQVITLQRNGWKGASEVEEQAFTVEGSMGRQEYNIYSGSLPGQSSDSSTQFALAVPVFPNFVELRPKARVHLVFFSLLVYDRSASVVARQRLVKKLQDLGRKVHSTLTKTKLPTAHRQAWNSLWQSGFGISESKADGSLNGDLINGTFYYILSQTPLTNSNERELFSYSEFERDQSSNSLLDQTASCYNGHSTLQANSLWSAQMETPDQINRIVNLWLLTLEKQGCHDLIASGAEGTQQALVLSMAAMQFTKHHVEFNQHPKELHRDYFIRRLRYGHGSRLNISVRVNEEDNRASLYVAIDQNDDHHRSYFACDAGCLDSPIRLNTLYSQFPVKLTEPLTAILYITSDHGHISELKHTIHVKEISLAPAHEQHVIALHKHGHNQVGTFTALFWALVVFLIVLFHIFLARIIYAEYLAGNLSASGGYDKLKSVVE